MAVGVGSAAPSAGAIRKRIKHVTATKNQTAKTTEAKLSSSLFFFIERFQCGSTHLWGRDGNVGAVFNNNLSVVLGLTH